MTTPSDRAAGGRRKRRPPAARSSSPQKGKKSSPAPPPTAPLLVGEGLKLRLPAGFIDVAICLVVMIVLAQLAYWVSPARDVLLLAATLIPLVYFFLWESISQTTPGKRLLGLRVVTTTGGPPGLAEHLLRAATRIPEALIILPYVLSIALSERNQRLGDSATDTLVVRSSRT